MISLTNASPPLLSSSHLMDHRSATCPPPCNLSAVVFARPPPFHQGNALECLLVLRLAPNSPPGLGTGSRQLSTTGPRLEAVRELSHVAPAYPQLLSAGPGLGLQAGNGLLEPLRESGQLWAGWTQPR
eukprot:CAMPEP_0174735080 /NCGR_PEP_ID=MMETSP1094-20130205/64346_1 /TAXON_ID=156173 /ORGANISM="Chrysochromulina brevifilum, Strain UTEX LB 985" /LENGTH=127 /DNA_ID=CAMNT_0015937997 /DNA_START=243 /DNA_END=623 /DNA_ORIENTATION=+